MWSQQIREGTPSEGAGPLTVGEWSLADGSGQWQMGRGHCESSGAHTDINRPNEGGGDSGVGKEELLG